MGAPAPKKKRVFMSLVEHIGNMFSSKGNRLVVSQASVDEFMERKRRADARSRRQAALDEERSDETRCQKNKTKRKNS